MTKIIVKDFMRTPYCWFPLGRTNELRWKIKKHITSEEKVELDFTGIKLLTAAFLNHTIGALYFDLTTEQVKKYLSVSNVWQEDLRMIKLVVDNAKKFYGHTKSEIKSINIYSEKNKKGELNESKENSQIRVF